MVAVGEKKRFLVLCSLSLFRQSFRYIRCTCFRLSLSCDCVSRTLNGYPFRLGALPQTIEGRVCRFRLLYVLNRLRFVFRDDSFAILSPFVGSLFFTFFILPFVFYFFSCYLAFPRRKSAQVFSNLHTLFCIFHFFKYRDDSFSLMDFYKIFSIGRP